MNGTQQSVADTKNLQRSAGFGSASWPLGLLASWPLGLKRYAGRRPTCDHSGSESHTDDLVEAPEALQTNFFGFDTGGKMSGLFDFVPVAADLRASEE